MTTFALLLIATGGLLSACVACEVPGSDGRACRASRDHDGIPDRADRGRDGVRNRRDRRPDDPRRY